MDEVRSQGDDMTRAQICDRAVFLSSVCKSEQADRAINEWLDVDAAQRQEIEDLRKQLSESVPRSRYDACNQDWLDAKAKLEQVQQAASKEIAQLEGRVQALEGALKGFLRFKTLVGYDEYRKAQAALAATGEIGTLNQYLEQINRSSPERSEG